MLLVEVSFEVGNKVGGIHTVLKTKARLMQHLFPEYLLIGYYDERKSPPEFEEESPPPWLEEIIAQVPGADFHYGTWLVPGRPRAVLVRPTGMWNQLNEIKYYYWDWYRIDSLRSDDWFNTPVLWSYVVGTFLRRLSEEKEIAAIFHEWLSGGALLYLRKFAPHVPTVFHTHATILGRTLANAGVDIYSMIDEGNRRGEEAPIELAYKYGIEAKHLMERASAQNAHVFTTVSSPTAVECKYMLGREPDYVLPNGLDMERVPPMEEISVMHTENEKVITDFVRAFFGPYYDFDPSNYLYFFFSGRYDLRAKGLDVLIDALSILNERLKWEHSEKGVVFFFWVAGPVYPPNPEVLDNLTKYRNIVNHVEKVLPHVRERIIADVTAGKLPVSDLLSENFLYDLRRILYTFKGKRGKLPPISTHLCPSDDYIFRRLQEVGLLNRPDDRVKVVYYPAYLSPGDGLLGLSYLDAVTGAHLGVFPSYYEPWGYTPLETAAMGVPAITTDVSGFGQYLRSIYGDWISAGSGILVLPRRNLDDTSFAEMLANTMHHILTMPRRERLEKKIEAKHMARNASWENVINRYRIAVDLAVRRASES